MKCKYLFWNILSYLIFHLIQSNINTKQNKQNGTGKTVSKTRSTVPFHPSFLHCPYLSPFPHLLSARSLHTFTSNFYLNFRTRQQSYFCLFKVCIFLLTVTPFIFVCVPWCFPIRSVWVAMEATHLLLTRKEDRIKILLYD